MFVVALLLIGVATAGCGGASADDERLQQEKLDKARKEGAEQATRDERLAQQAKEQVRLRKQLDALKKGQSGDSSNTAPGKPSVADATPTGSSGGRDSCGGGLSVGPNTTCSFAQNVKSSYFETSGGDQTFDVYSPVTQRDYSISCTGGQPHVCTGGNGASVYF